MPGRKHVFEALQAIDDKTPLLTPRGSVPVELIDPSTGQPYVASGGGGSSSNYQTGQGPVTPTTLRFTIANDGPLMTLLTARLPTSLAPPSQGDAALPVRPIGQLLDCAGFSSSGSNTLDSFFVQSPVVTGGMTYSQAGGLLSIGAGTTANAEFLARSVKPYRGALRKRFTVTSSNRIANNNLVVLLGDLMGENLTFNIVNATTVDVTLANHGLSAVHAGQFVFLGAVQGVAGAVPGRYAIAGIQDANTIRFTVSGWPAAGTGTLTLFGRNHIKTLFSGATATQAAIDSQRNGWAAGDTNITINTTASPGVLIQTDIDGRDLSWSDGLRASSTSPQVTQRGSRIENVPEPDIDLYVFLWCFNGTAAPASATTFSLGHLSMESLPNLGVYLQNTRNRSIPVSLNGAPSAATGRWFFQLSDGTNSPAVKAASTAALVADPALAVAVSPNSLAPIAIADIASAALTASANTAAITPTGGLSYEVNIAVTATSGSGQTLDVVIQESDDGGTNWFDVWHMPRITATGSYRSPKLPLTGNRVRYAQTVGGGTPSFTRSLNRLQSYDAVAPLRQLFDRTTINLLTANSTTPSLNVSGCRNVQVAINIGAATTAPTIQLEGSDDNGVSWYAIGAPLQSVASSTVQLTQTNTSAQLIRARVANVGAAVTLGYVMLKGF